ncbi:MAG: hypothetical protein ACC645_01000 [Pirellulales bacterium]
MSESNEALLTDEIMTALDAVGELEKWVETRLGDSTDRDLLNATYRDVTHRLLTVVPPKTAHWEHLIVATAARSAKQRETAATDACRAALAELRTMLQRDGFDQVAPERIVTLASAMTLALTAERKLRQPIEMTVELLVDRFPALLPDMAQRCQDIWLRRGQMSGEEGLFVWDTRNSQWRPRQDFKSHRPVAES